MSLYKNGNPIAAVLALVAMLVATCEVPATAAAPILAPLPDVVIGDLEDSNAQQDTNQFLFPDAFSFADFAADVDTTASELIWSFGEFSGETTVSRYLINGKPPVNAGDDAVIDDQDNGHPNATNPGDEHNISLGHATASFRDIVFSPLPDQPAYPEPTASEVSEAAGGKVIRYYVSDGQNLAYSDSLIRTIDDDIDSTETTQIQYEETYRQFGSFGDDWINQGLPWEAVSTNKAGDAIQITVQPTQGHSRIYGWRNASLLDYASVGPERFVRGKFYIYTDVSMFAPLNKVPNFRIGLMNEDAVRAMTHFELASTGASDPGHEPFYAAINDPKPEEYTYWLRPADNIISPTPSLYRIDFDPVDVPAAQNSTIGAFMESYTIADPANGSLFLTEIVLGTYDALDNSGDLEWVYNRTLPGTFPGFNNELTGGAFNHEANLVAGYLQDLYLPGTDEQGYFTYVDESYQGIVGDTDAVDTDVFGVGLISLESGQNIDKLRISPNRLYHARFYATSSVPTDTDNPDVESQGLVRFRFQTVDNRVSYLLELMSLAAGSLAGHHTPNADNIAAQAPPGIGSLNPDTDPNLDMPGESGGWYSVVVPSPMDVAGIRNDVETYYQTTQNSFFFLNFEPGPGSADDSARDVVLGVDLVQGPEVVIVSFGPYALSRPNRAMVRLSAIEVYSYPAIDDGGFDATPQTE